MSAPVVGTVQVIYPLRESQVVKHKSTLDGEECRHNHETEGSALACGERRARRRGRPCRVLAQHAVTATALDRANDPAALLTAAFGKVVHEVIAEGVRPMEVHAHIVTGTDRLTVIASGLAFR